MRIRVAAVAVSVLAAACTGSSGSDGEVAGKTITSQDVPEGVSSLLLEGHLELDVTGTVEASWSGETPINVVRSAGVGMPKAYWQLTVGILPAHVLEADDLRLRPAFDLLGFDGNGDYDVRPITEGLDEQAARDAQARGDIEALGDANAVQSNAFLLVEKDGEITNFNVVEERCVVRVEDGGYRGSIECPRVSNGNEAVSFEWSWTVDPDQVIEDLVKTAEDALKREQAKAEETTSTSAAADNASDDPSPSTVPGDRYGIQADFPLDVVIEPRECATVGSPATVTVKTLPNAAISLISVYSDGNYRGGASIGRTDPTGLWRWVFAVPADAPPGQVDILVSVSTDERAGGGNVRAFEVRSRC